MPRHLPNEDWDEQKLKETHALYNKYYDEWVFLNAAYEGIRALVEWGAIEKHERESEDNYQRRLEEVYGFSYSRSIVDLFNSYLFKKEYPRTIPDSLASDPQWLTFQDNCDMNGLEFDELFINEQRQASIQGIVGLLVDKPSVQIKNRAEELYYGIYPYIATYKPTAILDWEYERDEFGRRRLVFLKLLDDDGYYRIWTRDKWEVWEIKKNKDDAGVYELPEAAGQKAIRTTGLAVEKINEGINPLGEIPFVWLMNQRSTIDKEVGISDIGDVSRIDVSIIRNLSQIEEIINYAAFPMMRKPMQEKGKEMEDRSGPTAVLEFDPEHPESKPDWLTADVLSPVQAALNVIDKKITEIYRAMNVGGITATESGDSTMSGVALKIDFQLLNGKLVKKSKHVVRAKRAVVDFWLKWQGLYDQLVEEIEFEYIKTFEVEDLASDLENLLTAGAVVTYSDTFKKETQKKGARMIIPPAEDELLAVIDQEIDEYEEVYPEFYPQEGDGTTPPGATGNTTTTEVVEE